MHSFILTTLSSSAGAFLIFLVLSFASVSSASQVEVTIDDTTGDGQPGGLPVYEHAEGGKRWMTNTDCEDNVPGMCPTEIVSASTVFNTTWHATWGNAGVTMTFNGSAVSVYLITPGYVSLESGIVGTNVSFYLDGIPVQPFIYVPRVGDIAQNLPAYTDTGLTDGIHKLTIHANSHVVHNEANLSTIAFFDRAVYSLGVKNAATPTHGPDLLIGGIVGGISLIAIASALCTCIMRKRTKKKLKCKQYIEPFDGVWTRIKTESRARFSFTTLAPLYSLTPPDLHVKAMESVQKKYRKSVLAAGLRAPPTSGHRQAPRGGCTTADQLAAAAASEAEPLGLGAEFDADCEGDVDLPTYESLEPIVPTESRGSGWRDSLKWVRRVSRVPWRRQESE